MRHDARLLMLGVPILVLLSGTVVGQAPAPTPTVPVPNPAPLQPGWVARGAAELQALDKVYARAAVFRVKRGGAAKYGAIDIAVHACFVRPPDQEADAAAFLVISAPESGVVLFRGWMFANNPAVAMLEHPIYDIRVIGCQP